MQLDGRCPQGLLHHRFAYITFDCTTVAAWDFPGGDAPIAARITVPRCAQPGLHVVQLLGPFVTSGDVYLPLEVTDEPPPCAGDCDGDGRVSVAELITGVRIALGDAPIEQCLPFDADGGGGVSVDELTLGVGTALHTCSFTGCPAR